MNIKLRKLESKDAKGMLEWMTDSEVYKFFRFDVSHITMESTLAFIDEANKQFADKTDYNFAIVNDNDEYLGTISLKHIDDEVKSAEYAISLRKCTQGKGVGTQATKQLLEYAFNVLGLNRVYLNVLSDNEAAIRLYERCGFVYEGEFVNHISIRGEVKSLKWYAIIK